MRQVAVVAVKHTKGKGSDYLERLERELASKQVVVGFFDHSKYDETGEPIAQVAATHEMGSPSKNIPPRPFMQHKLESNRGKLSAAFLSGLEQGADVALNRLGLVAQSTVRDGIREVTAPPLAQSTIAARASRNSKGMASTKPLVDTGQMLRAVEYEVQNVSE